MRRTLRYVSDLHTEFMRNIDCQALRPLWKDINYKNINYLALIGDIGSPFLNNEGSKNLDLFFRMISDNYDRVIFVPGNHEYYSDNIPYYEIEKYLQELTSAYNISMLNNGTIHLDNEIKLIGTTLWSRISESKKLTLGTKLTNFKHIKSHNGQLFDVDTNNALNKAAIKYIKEQINTDKKCIILSHYSPLMPKEGQLTADSKFIGCPRLEGYHNNLNMLIKRPIVAWLYGHTHYNNTFYYKNVLFSSNQLGYSKESKHFNPLKELDLDKL